MNVDISIKKLFKKKLKVYISLPMAGQESTVYKRYHAACEKVKKLCPKCKLIGPINIQDFSENGLDVPRSHPYDWYILHDIKNVMHSDMIYITQGWENSKGCRIEKYIAEEFNKLIIFE